MRRASADQALVIQKPQPTVTRPRPIVIVNKLLPITALMLALGAAPGARAVDVGSTQLGVVNDARSTATTSTATISGGAASDAMLAQMWSLSIPEVQRAKALMQGPRGAFSSLQLSPIEALGIHARNDAERLRYARLFAKVSLDDTQRVLAWSTVAQAEMQRITAGMAVLDFAAVPKAAVSEEAADILGVPHAAVVPPVRPARAAARPRPPIARATGRAVDNRGRTTTKAGGQ